MRYNSFLTYGFELELVDVDRRTQLPLGCSWNNAEVTLVNSDGTAVCSNDINKPYGGEINTIPTKSMSEQFYLIGKCLDLFPNAKVNYRCNTQVTIGFDKAVFRPEHVYRIAKYAYDNYNTIIRNTVGVQPKVNKHSNYTIAELDKIRRAQSFEDMYTSLYSSKSGFITPLVAKRRFINILSLFKYGAVEFRHFHGCRTMYYIKSCFLFAERFIRHALTDMIPVNEYIKHYDFPPQLEYNQQLEDSFNNTKVDSLIVKPLKLATTKYYTDNKLNYRS